MLRLVENYDRNSKADPVFNGGAWGKNQFKMDIALWCYQWDGWD